MSTQYRLVQSGKTASGGCSASQGSSEPVAPRILFYPYKRISEQIFESWPGKWSIARSGSGWMVAKIFLNILSVFFMSS
jgi:hypothetical protein